jgi:hypothetical protein
VASEPACALPCLRGKASEAPSPEDSVRVRTSRAGQDPESRARVRARESAARMGRRMGLLTWQAVPLVPWISGWNNNAVTGG